MCVCEWGGGGGGGRGRVEQSKRIECFLHNFHQKLTKKCVSNVIRIICPLTSTFPTNG